jgi:large subunit ribosomal protein L4
MVAPVAEFNTYNILKQRYLVLTREALATLKDRVKQQAGGREPGPAAPDTEN